MLEQSRNQQQGIDEIDAEDPPGKDLGQITMKAGQLDQKGFRRNARVSEELARNLNSLNRIHGMQLEPKKLFTILLRAANGDKLPLFFDLIRYINQNSLETCGFIWALV